MTVMNVKFVLTGLSVLGVAANPGRLRNVHCKQTKMAIKLNLVFYKKANLPVYEDANGGAQNAATANSSPPPQQLPETKIYANDFSSGRIESSGWVPELARKAFCAAKRHFGSKFRTVDAQRFGPSKLDLVQPYRAS